MNAHFSTQHLSGDLKRLSVRGGAATFTGQGVKFVLNLGSTMILARLLSPQDFGLIAMVTAVTGFIMIFKDLGLSMATVQRAEINHGQVSTLFWINVAISAVLMLLTLALAPAVAWFYDDPRLTAVTAALAIAFLFGGLTVQHQALLRRQMRLSAVTVIDVLALVAGILTAILCAWVGLGYWSLVWMQIATAAINAVGVWVASGWIPGRPMRRSGVRSMLKFGGYLTGSSFLGYFSRNLDNILIGRYCGAESLGIYAKAYSLLLLPIGQLVAPMTSVAVPALSQLQHDPVRYLRYYTQAVKLVAYLAFPLVVTLAVLSEEVVSLILGSQWQDAIPIFRILAFTAMFQPITSTVGWIYISLGNTRRMAIWDMIASPTIMLSIIIGIPWGIHGVALCYTIGNILRFIPTLAFAFKGSPVVIKDFLLAICRPFLLSIFCGLGMLACHEYLSGNPQGWGITVTFITGGCVAVVFLGISKSIRNDIADICKVLKILFVGKRDAYS